MKRLIKSGLALAALAFVAPTFVIQAAQAQTTETFTATAAVASSLTITENTALSFGNLVVIQDGTNAADATLSPTGTFTAGTPTGTENLVQTGTPAAGNFTVNAGVASFMSVQVTFPSAAVTLTNSSAPPANGTFSVDDFVIGTPSAGTMGGTTTTLAACNTAIGNGDPCQFTTSTGGLLTFGLGATITVGSATATFADGTYSGSFDLTAAFY